ncbi:hypothetical protein AGR56_17485 [Clostridium sp. DMHC 10]|uniref:hypothetical protein n=1 Tax=Clostridium sp. DMHC 10 TaxID=747377 RepID=UPI00069E53DE|nr:hypothetical protein [Clostridium sp. DMHC 10]KOF55651.1 hypothetical protein AGR56_17485 [Clostridium sp. DMHC 10]
MNEKKELMKKILIFVGILGYVCLSFLPIEFKVIFFVIAILSVIVYLAESIMNNYGRVHIAMSILAFLLFIGLMLHYLIQNKFIQYNVWDNYLLLFESLVVIIMFSVACVNYFKKANKRQSITMIIMILIIIIGVIAVILLIILKKLGIIPA